MNSMKRIPKPVPSQVYDRDATVTPPLHDSDRTSPRRSVTLAEASAMAGIKINAMRRRLQRRTESGYKNNQKRWIVYVNPTWNTDVTRPYDSDATMAPALHDRDATVTSPLYDNLNKTIEILTAQVVAKDKQLAEKDAQIERKDVQISQHATTIQALIQRMPPTADSEVAELKKRIIKQKNIVNRAWKILRQQLKAV